MYTTYYVSKTDRIIESKTTDIFSVENMVQMTWKADQGCVSEEYFKQTIIFIANYITSCNLSLPVTS
jgi:hypothetical protein